ncbi:unnamed protein product [Haemonchus placei]|uniref:Uncharacterized protein n=1 Tax=Haemonchus placei TaxID=6290 RepID=A0A0N4W557_HAEPC|nr:unnamed protein product [Haemonchus placei]
MFDQNAVNSKSKIVFLVVKKEGCLFIDGNNAPHAILMLSREIAECVTAQGNQTKRKNKA